MRNDHRQLVEAARRRVLSRRGFLGHVFTGLGGIGLAHLLAGDLAAGLPREGGADGATAWGPGRGLTHFPAKASRVLQIFCPGAASQVDLWDHKPELERRDGQPLPGEEDFVSFQGKNGSLMKSPWPFAPQGRAASRSARCSRTWPGMWTTSRSSTR